MAKSTTDSIAVLSNSTISTLVAVRDIIAKSLLLRPNKTPKTNAPNAKPT